jgi:hypothetical protein
MGPHGTDTVVAVNIGPLAADLFDALYIRVGDRCRYNTCSGPNFNVATVNCV